ncbi:threonine ammonia-lyase [Flammeovirgaceae bacterium SG7u.111]|nr:threonine ammonia-lyase [Flammeovirgaceae bacterium SG7u.132]WPO33356.1 threonine ammonia-lyase [Flammeovirgaceae bacterium SG7u.111]
MTYIPSVPDIINANSILKDILSYTPLQQNLRLSEEYAANILLKREDLQIVRSYKIRGAYHKMKSLSAEELSKGVVCASAGNHAQGVAYSCRVLGVHGSIYMPQTTPKQKIRQVQNFGKDNVKIILIGDTYDDCYNAAREYSNTASLPFIHPFDDEKIIEGQATVAFEIEQQFDKKIDYLFVPIGGGGLISGVTSYFKQIHPETKIIGIEPAGAPAMKKSLEAGKVITLDSIDKFVDGAAVKQVGQLPFELCKHYGIEITLVPEGHICTNILELYNLDAIVVEPAGALSIAVLDYFKEEIKGKNVVCILSGSNNDITRTEEIKERSLLFKGLKHYFMVRFPQRAGALRDFVDKVLGANDDITLFEYRKKTSRERGPALIGIELQKQEDLEGLRERMKENGFVAEYLNEKPDLFQYLI